ncbi:MAG: hypothetical protein KGY76_09525, partial [Candidatus Thermoplasmatota archaeon]|nr:hypothetical protein [Candidatus Thermoplasmatota archaeon]
EVGVIEDIYKECPKSAMDLEELPVHSILLVLGGYIAIGIGTFHFLISIIKVFDPYVIFHFLTNIVFGFGLLISFYRIEQGIEKWAVVAGVFSLILIILGGIVGALAGIVAIFGAGLAILSSFDETFEM